MEYLTVDQILELHKRIIDLTGGSVGVRDLGALESSVAQPQMTFAGEDLYPSLVEKASALGFSLVMNHPFVDGNKRAGHAPMEIFLVLNGYEISANIDEQEQIILQIAASQSGRDEFTKWVKDHLVAAKIK